MRRPTIRAAVIAIAIAALGPLTTIGTSGRVRSMDLMSDPAELTGAPWYAGAISNFTLLAWAAGATAFLTLAVGLRHRSPQYASAVAWMGGLTVLLVLDDQLLLHEVVIPEALGVPELAVYAAYGVLFGAVALRFGQVLVQQRGAALLLLAVVAMGASVGLDILGWDVSARRPAEEALKLLGVTWWGVYPVVALVREISRSSSGPVATGEPGGEAGLVGRPDLVERPTGSAR